VILRGEIVERGVDGLVGAARGCIERDAKLG
jgi:hypothetical protein